MGERKIILPPLVSASSKLGIAVGFGGRVRTVADGSITAMAGLRAGDVIVSVDGVPMAKATKEEVATKLRGDLSRPAPRKVVVRRGGDDDDDDDDDAPLVGPRTAARGSAQAVRKARRDHGLPATAGGLDGEGLTSKKKTGSNNSLDAMFSAVGLGRGGSQDDDDDDDDDEYDDEEESVGPEPERWTYQRPAGHALLEDEQGEGQAPPSIRHVILVETGEAEARVARSAVPPKFVRQGHGVIARTICAGIGDGDVSRWRGVDDMTGRDTSATVGAEAREALTATGSLPVMGRTCICEVVAVGGAVGGRLAKGDVIIVGDEALRMNEHGDDTARAGSWGGCQTSFVHIPRAALAIEAGHVAKVPKGIHAEEALLAGEELLTAVHAVGTLAPSLETTAVQKRVLTALHQKGVKPARRAYAVLGCNALGLMVVVTLRYLYPDAAIVAADEFEARRALATKFGATHTVPPHELTRLVARVTSGRGCDGVCETVGRSNAVLKVAFSIVADGGSLAICAGMPLAPPPPAAADGSTALVDAASSAPDAAEATPEPPPFTQADCFRRSVRVCYGRGVRAALPFALELVAELKSKSASANESRLRRKKADEPPDQKMWSGSIRDVVTHRLSFELCQHGYEIASAKSDGCVKVVLYPAADAHERGGRRSTLAASLD